MCGGKGAGNGRNMEKFMLVWHLSAYTKDLVAAYSTSEYGSPYHETFRGWENGCFMRCNWTFLNLCLIVVQMEHVGLKRAVSKLANE